MLKREDALAGLFPRSEDHLFVAGLGNAVFDLVSFTKDAPLVFPLDGAMGAAVPMGLGLAMARPDRHVAVVTGDGELLMNVGALATAAAQAPPNLCIVCLDNGQYGLTGGQLTHTSLGTNLAAAAAAFGIKRTMTVFNHDELRAACEWANDGLQLTFILVKVEAGNSPPVPVDRDAAACRIRFRQSVLELR